MVRIPTLTRTGYAPSQTSALQPVPESWQMVPDPHPRIHNLHNRIARKRDQWLTLQIEKSHVMQEYIHKRRFFEESTGVIMESFRKGDGFTNPVSESQAYQLRTDSEALRIQSDALQELERRSAIIQCAIARLEARLMDSIGALAGLMPGKTSASASRSESDTESDF